MMGTCLAKLKVISLSVQSVVTQVLPFREFQLICILKTFPLTYATILSNDRFVAMSMSVTLASHLVLTLTLLPGLDPSLINNVISSGDLIKVTTIITMSIFFQRFL